MSCRTNRIEALPHAKVELSFSPQALTTIAQINVVNKWAISMSDTAISQDGCAVCGSLTYLSNLHKLELTLQMSKLLTNHSAVPRGWISPAAQRTSWTQDEYHKEWIELDHNAIEQDLLAETGPLKVNPILDRQCYSWYEDSKSWSPQCCTTCLEQLKDNTTPSMALCNGYFSGTIPTCLAELTFMERLIISKLRHNFFTIDLSSSYIKGGVHKYIRANAIVFATPYEEVMDDYIWPMRSHDLNKVVVCTFIGSDKPTSDELIQIREKCYFLTIRYNYLVKAVHFLQKYNRHYINVQANNNSLDSYKDQHAFPIHFLQKPRKSNATLEPSLIDEHIDDTMEGISFVLRGVTADDISQLSSAKRKLHALNHIKNGGHVLGIGHSTELESLWNNPENWEKLFCHLYPFGIGGPKNLRNVDYIKSKLTYHSRAFQQDNVWMMMLYNQKEILSVTNRARIIIKKNDFKKFTESLESISDSVIESMSQKVSMNGLPKPETTEEQDLISLCKLINNGRSWVKGSSVEKLILRSQLFNMSRFEGVPVFFLTYSPGDISNPITCKFVGMDINVDDLVHCKVPEWKERVFAIYHDPVSTERFFHYSVTCFIECFIMSGLFGPDPLFCGPVEEQGRKSLHWHLLLWLRHTETLTQIKAKLQTNVEFKKAFISWIESVVQCGYINEEESEVAERNKNFDRNSRFTSFIKLIFKSFALVLHPIIGKTLDPKLALKYNSIYDIPAFYMKCNDDLYNKHRHSCGDHCLRDGLCKARFPRNIVKESHIDEKGHFHLAQLNANTNRPTALISYASGSNNDCTPLQSGTSTKGAICYTTNYSSKSPLKMQTTFDTIKAVMTSSTAKYDEVEDIDLLGKKLLIKMCNILTVKMEMGGPMVAHYLFGGKGFYSNIIFKDLYWTNFTNYITSCANRTFDDDNACDTQSSDMESVSSQADEVNEPFTSMQYDVDDENSNKIEIILNEDEVIGMPIVSSYTMRGTEMDNINLFEFYSSYEIRDYSSCHKGTLLGYLSIC